MKTDHPTNSPGDLAKSLLVNLLIWFGLNIAVLAVVSFVAFALLNRIALAPPDTAFTYALLCAVPSALTVSSVVAGRRLLADLKRRS